MSMSSCNYFFTVYFALKATHKNQSWTQDASKYFYINMWFKKWQRPCSIKILSQTEPLVFILLYYYYYYYIQQRKHYLNLHHAIKIKLFIVLMCCMNDNTYLLKLVLMCCHIIQSNVCNMTYLDHVHKLTTQVLWNCCIDHTRIKLGLFPTKCKFAYILTRVFKSFHSSRLPRSINRGLPCAGQRLATKCQRREVKRFSKMQPLRYIFCVSEDVF